MLIFGALGTLGDIAPSSHCDAHQKYLVLMMIFAALGDTTPYSLCDAHQKYLHGASTTDVDDDIWCSW